VDIRVEVCDDCALALGNGDVLMAGALDDSKRYVFLRHYTLVSMRYLNNAKSSLDVLLTGWRCRDV
jgi:hypothetical protein